MFIVIFRTCILYLLVVLVIRLMGKRQIGELQPYELVITIVISDLATVPMQDVRLPLILGIIPIMSLLILELILTELQLKSNFMRKIIDGNPSIIIKNGKLNEKELKSQRINLDDLMEELRVSGNLDISKIKYALLENNGQLSIIPMDNNIMNLPAILYIDGQYNKETLSKMNKDVEWLKQKLQNKGVNIEDTFIVLIDSTGKLIHQLKGDFEKMESEKK
ncbi:DUF421 domain-containing protein [Clostridium sp. 'White wine YQ']|uniref:DUF421 domain-containing protein n=1 Tax=Clostridium sp. 'White wine YQ' TaxID=3027474 RepID=UPI002366FA20|nr:DUF421 domain-containing protein [Clostridium sp. 'White wine YQ']MDD7794915.1 DUF421 domain-containing protein [Clostridium sp. 'White wine YQ']